MRAGRGAVVGTVEQSDGSWGRSWPVLTAPGQEAFRQPDDVSASSQANPVPMGKVAGHTTAFAARGWAPITVKNASSALGP